MDISLSHFLPYPLLQKLIDALHLSGFSCVGPQVRDGAIVYDTLTKAEQLPWGMQDHQAPGEYQLNSIPEPKAFAWANGPQAIKPTLFKPIETIWKVIRNSEGQLEFQPQPALEKPIAIFGARSCDLAAMAIQDRVFLSQGKADPRYQTRRKNLFIIAVNCSYSSDNCFCVSAGTGPEAKNPYDLLLTELEGGFLVKSGSIKGQALLDDFNLKQSTAAQESKAQEHIEHAAQMQTKRIPMDNQKGLRDLLFSNLNHPRWEEVAERCLSCGNCTAVCPTCFCHSETEKPSLDGTSSEHQREWDSCFTAGHSYLAGKPIRESTRQRYRQWLTHKVGSWFDQFDTSGCVGCGRCVTWCPVGIDITEELSAIAGESNQRGEIND